MWFDVRHNHNISPIIFDRFINGKSTIIVADNFNTMAPVFHANKKVERKPFEKKRTQQFKRTNRRDKYKSRNIELETNEYRRKNGKYNVIVQDFVIYDALPVSDLKVKNMPNTRTMQKRKLSSEDDYECDWAPHPTRIKPDQTDVSLYEDFIADEFDNPHVVPDCEETEQEISRLSYEGDTDDSLHSKDIQIVTIDEVIEFDSLKSNSGHDLHDAPFCFDIHKLCEIVGSKEDNEKSLSNEKQSEPLDVLLTFTNNSDLVIFDDGDNVLKQVKEIDYSQLFDCNDSCEAEDSQDTWPNDCQIEEFKFARCFKCRRKVKGVDCFKK